MYKFNIYIYIYIYIYDVLVGMCVYIYVYICIHNEWYTMCEVRCRQYISKFWVVCARFC